MIKAIAKVLGVAAVLMGSAINPSFAQQSIGTITVISGRYCAYLFDNSMGVESGYQRLVCEGDPGFTEHFGDCPECNLGSTGSPTPPAPTTPSTAEAERLETCRKANIEHAIMTCDSRQSTMPTNQLNMAFSLGDRYVFLKGLVLAFHQQLWNDPTENTWSNYGTLFDQMNNKCVENQGVINTYITGPICQVAVSNYFGAFWGIGGISFETSSAAADFSTTKFGQACVNVRATRAQNNC